VVRRLSRVVPVHPRARGPWDASGLIAGLTLVGPLGYLDFLALEAGAALVPTDSGGAQEETDGARRVVPHLAGHTERPSR
jgi:UDP-N-acetylglucosamine 2-epimerase (non-hydrolysing)